MLVCHCFDLTDEDIREAITDGASSLRDVAAACDGGQGCGRCVPLIVEMLDGAPTPTGRIGA